MHTDILNYMTRTLALEDTVSNLRAENIELKDLLADTVQRIAKLESEVQKWNDEGNNDYYDDGND